MGTSLNMAKLYIGLNKIRPKNPELLWGFDLQISTHSTWNFARLNPAIAQRNYNKVYREMQKIAIFPEIIKSFY